MEKLVLRKLNVNDKAAFINALSLWDFSSGFTWVRGYDPGMDFLDYIELLRSFEIAEDLPEGYVPDTALFGFVGAEIVGRLSIRHTLNDFLLKIGGHIGYGVLPPFRRKGYAKEMLRLSLPVAKELGIKRALVTCDETNLGSIKVIESNGGVLENTVFVDVQ